MIIQVEEAYIKPIIWGFRSLPVKSPTIKYGDNLESYISVSKIFINMFCDKNSLKKVEQEKQISLTSKFQNKFV